jgi:hypothetical protein
MITSFCFRPAYDTDQYFGLIYAAAAKNSNNNNNNNNNNNKHAHK